MNEYPCGRQDWTCEGFNPPAPGASVRCTQHRGFRPFSMTRIWSGRRGWCRWCGWQSRRGCMPAVEAVERAVGERGDEGVVCGRGDAGRRRQHRRPRRPTSRRDEPGLHRCPGAVDVGPVPARFHLRDVRQLGAVHTRVLAGLGTAAPRQLAGTDGLAFVDIDDTIRQVHGYAQEGRRRRLLRGQWT